ncbi:hypothetical protein PENSPDRAFT_757623 [Peniophora sp. CONT]|nr:hypothetical protein PENSPDRAFT_757623 [Peniophora sp. CONT]
MREKCGYETSYEETWDTAHLDDAIGFFQQAADAAPRPNAYVLGWLGVCLSKRFDTRGNLDDLKRSILAKQCALKLVADEHPDKAMRLNDLAYSLRQRFERLDQLEDLESAFTMQTRAVELTPDGHSDMAMRLDNFGYLQHLRYERLGDVNDLEHAVAGRRRAVELTPDGHPDMPIRLNHLGWSLRTRFQGLGQLEDLESAIRMQHRAVQLTPDGHPDMAMWLNNLMVSKFFRFLRLDDRDDLQQAIVGQRRVIELTPDGHPHMPERLDNLGHLLRTRFQHLGELRDLEGAIRMQHRAIDLAPDGHPDLAGQLDSLAFSQHLRSEHLGCLEDLEHAIAARLRAVELTPDGHPNMPTRLNNLAYSLKQRFERCGKLEDLERAIQMQRRAIKLTPDRHPDMSVRLDNLGRLQVLRYGRLGDLDDLEHAVAIQQLAVELAPDGHPSVPTRLTNLGLSLSARYERTGELDDLESAIRMHSRAVELAPEGHAGKASLLNNLALSQQLRFLRLGDLNDIDCAILGQRRAVELTPDEHHIKPIRLNNLGHLLRIRFVRVREVIDLEHAILALRRAVVLAPDTHPFRPSVLLNFGYSLATQFRLERTETCFNEAVSCLMAATDRRLGVPSSRLHAAQVVVELLTENPKYSTPQTLLLAHSRILDMFPELVWLGHNLSRRLKESQQLRGLAHSAVRVAIAAGAFTQAVEWLDAGTSFIWSQVLSLRSPVDELAEHHPNLALSIERLNAQLQGTVSTSFLPDSVSVTSGHDIPALVTGVEADRHRGLAIDYEQILADIRCQSGFEDFLKPKKLAALLPSHTPLSRDFQKRLHTLNPTVAVERSANILAGKVEFGAEVIAASYVGLKVSSGPVVFINVDRASCDALVLTPEKTIFIVTLPDLSFDKAEALRAQWRSYLQQHNIRERGLAARNYRHSSCTPVVRMLGCIWRWIVHPILKALRVCELKPDCGRLPHINWCPTGPLTQIPLHAAGIYDEEFGPRVYDFVVSSYTPSLSALTRCVNGVANEQRTINPSVLIVTQPDTPKLSPLLGTVVEGERLQQVLVQSQIAYSALNGKLASISTVRAALDNHSWLHLACHGSQDLTDPMKSAFALYDGPLSLTDLMGTKADNAEIAFLSACQTAVGDEKIPEESMHLAAGMLAAGFKGVIATMWSIRDDDAPVVVETYYQKLLECRASGKLGKGETGAAYALHQATKRLREEVGEKEFVRWAPQLASLEKRDPVLSIATACRRPSPHLRGQLNIIPRLAVPTSAYLAESDDTLFYDSDDEVAQAVAPHHQQQAPFASSSSTASSDSLDLPPRKRLRMTEDDVLKRKRATMPPQRDPDYYMSDGSCVLLVDNILFNVHRTLLARDSSFFSSLFLVPSPSSSPPDGSSDDNPLVLHDDSAPAFRNFLWVLYALPHEIATGADLRRLIDIARTANKYGFKSVEMWALDSIVDALTRKPPQAAPSSFGFSLAAASASGPSSTNVAPPLVASNTQVIELVRLAQLCSHKRLLDSMVNALKRAMHAGVQNAYLALTLADELGLRALQGEAYLEVLLRHFPDRVVVMKESQHHEGLGLGEFEDSSTGARLLISRTQQLRLLAGHYRLVTTWDTLRRGPLPIEHAPACELNWQKSSCAQSWLEFWRDKSSSSSAVLGCAPADVLGRLKAMGREFERLGTTTMMHPECRNCARRAIGERVKDVSEGLAEVFAEDFE